MADTHMRREPVRSGKGLADYARRLGEAGARMQNTVAVVIRSSL